MSVKMSKNLDPSERGKILYNNEINPKLYKISKIELIDRIKSINAMQIELIAIKIVNKILANLKTFSKQGVKNLSIKIRKDPFNNTFEFLDKTLYKKTSNVDEMSISLNSSHFKLKILAFVIKSLQQAFSHAEKFIDSNVEFIMSDEKLNKILIKIAKEIGFEIKTQLPGKYFIFFQLDLESSRKESELIFQIFEINKNNVFSSSKFSLESLEDSNLEDPFYKSKL